MWHVAPSDTTGWELFPPSKPRAGVTLARQHSPRGRNGTHPDTGSPRTGESDAAALRALLVTAARKSIGTGSSMPDAAPPLPPLARRRTTDRRAPVTARTGTSHGVAAA